MAISPRSNLLIAAPQDGLITAHSLDNKHPEISWSALWAEVWYEGYEEPIFSWQSSSADNDFEPKFSSPLSFRHHESRFLRAAIRCAYCVDGSNLYRLFYGASNARSGQAGYRNYGRSAHGYFGFSWRLVAGPIIEANLSSVLSIFVFLPVLLFAFALAWSLLPEKIVHSTSGWYGLIVTPLILGSVYLAFQFGPFFENTFLAATVAPGFLRSGA